MKLSRPVSCLPPQPEPSAQPLDSRASGQSISAGGHGSSGSAQGYKDPPDQFQGSPHHERPGISFRERFHRGAVGEGVERRPCASGTSIRGGGHSGTVSCSFAHSEGSAPGVSQKKPSPLEKLAGKLGDMLKKLFAAIEPEHHRGRVATGESARSSGSSHSGTGQGRTGVDEPT